MLVDIDQISIIKDLSYNLSFKRQSAHQHPKNQIEGARIMSGIQPAEEAHIL